MKKIVATFIIIFCACILVLNTDWFKNRLFNFVTTRIEQATGMHITVGSFSYQFPLHFRLQNIALGTPEDPDLTIAELYLNASLSGLWRNEIKIHDLNIDHVIVHRTVQFPEKGKSSVPVEIPVPFNLTHFAISDLELDPRLPPIGIEGHLQAHGPAANGFARINIATLSLAMDLNYHRDTGLALNIQEGMTGPLSFGGQLYLSPEFTLDRTRFQVQLTNVNVLERWIPLTMHGKLAATCEINGPVLRPQASVDINSKRLFVFGYAWENFKTSLQCQYEDHSLTGSIQLASSGADYHIHSNADFEWKIGQLLRLPQLLLEGPHTRLSGSFLADLVTGGIESQVEGSTDDLTFLQEIIDDPVTGKIAFQSNFTKSAENGQKVDLIIQGDNLQIATWEAGKAEITIHGEHIDTEPETQVNIHIENFLWNSFHMDALTCETQINQKEEKWPFQISGESKSDILTNLTARGFWHSDQDSTLLAVDSCQGRLFDEEATVMQPVTIRVSPEILNISPLAIQFGQSKLFATTDLTRQNFASTIHLEEFPLEWIQKIDPSMAVSGRANAAFSLRGDPAQPEGKIEIQLQDLKIAENMFSKLPVLNGILRAELKDGQIACTGVLEGLEKQPISVDAKLPILLSFYPLQANLKTDEDLFAQFRVKGDITPLLQLFASDDTNLRGQTDVSIDITGTFNNPQISGKAVLQNGTYESVKTGAVFKDITALFEGAGNQIHLKELYASDRYEGYLTGSGLLILDPANHFPYHVDFNVFNTRFFNLDFADAVFSGTTRLEGTTQEGLLTGKLEADRLAIVIPERLPTAAHSVDVKFVNTPKGQKQPQYSSKPKMEWPLKLDLALTVPKAASITGNNLDTTWKGAATINGTASTPEIHGELKVVQGTYLVSGKEFSIDKGTISFAGDIEKKTSLYIIASYDLGKIIAEIILRGPIKNPTISFRSNPPLSQREILAWILFGRGISDISATEGAQLNQSITNLKSNNSGTDMLTKLRNKIGIDRIDINRADNEDSNQVSIQVGKYISQGVYVSVNKSVTAESNQVALEANLSREFKLQAEVGDDQEGQLLLKWKKDY